MQTIRIKDPALDQKEITQKLNDAVSQMPPLPDLARSGPVRLHRRSTATAVAPHQNLPEFSHALIELIDTATLQETEFKSNAPVIGSLIVKFRQLWNWMSTRWYVLPLIHQQTDVNMQAALLFLEITQIQEESARRIIQLEAHIKLLEEKLAQAEQNRL